MAFYDYKAADQEGRVVKGTLHAKDEEEALSLLYEKELLILSIKKKNYGRTYFLKRKLSKIELSNFCRQFSVMLTAGISIYEGLILMGRQNQNSELKKILIEICEDIQRGDTLTGAFSAHKSFFPKLMLDLLQVGEQGGILEEVLNDLSIHFAKEDKFNKKLRNSLFYPMLVLTLAIIVAVFLVVKVVPAFIAAIQDLNGELPGITRMMMFLSSELRENFIVLIIFFISSLFGLITFARHPEGKKVYGRLLLTVPFIKGIYKKIITARFSRYCGLLLKNGVTILRALEVMKEVLPEAVFKEKMNITNENIKKGMSLTSALSLCNIFDEVFLSMLSVGEHSGNLDIMMGHCAELYDAEVDRFFERLVILLEPAVVLVMAAVVGTIVLSIILPMFQVMNSIQM